ncbi:hypothetical protein F5Y13DRAFT_206637 [Hypoxylon sp. FL1857]|nr:hypothetical protein F5Y13DRAFT_206637 [Hypoxylon sp. FL1857]
MTPPDDTAHDESGDQPTTKKRRSHKKSRAGCQSCKMRKVKCDEVKPICGGCTRFSLPCYFPSLPASEQPRERDNPFFRPKRGRPRKDWASLANASSTEDTERRLSETATSSSASITEEPRALNVDDLELIYHFTRDDSLSLGNGGIWRDEVLRLGFEYHCVLHLVLALSALHLAALRPSESTKYEELADSHSALGLRLVTDLLPDLSHDNCHALYFATTLVCFVTLSKRSARGHLLVMADGWEVAWWNLFRGVRYVVETIGIESVLGAVKPLPVNFEEQHNDKQVTRVVYWEEPLSKIADLISQTSHVDLQLYQKLLADLSRCFCETYGTIENPIGGLNGRFEVVIAWLYRMEDDFAARLKDRQPISLIILAHFAVLFHSLEYVWCLRGWASHILVSIRDTLDEDYAHWLDWPIEAVEDAERIRQQSIATLLA